MLTYSSIVPVKTIRENLLAGRFFRVFDWGQNNRYFDSSVKNTNVPQFFCGTVSFWCVPVAWLIKNSWWVLQSNSDSTQQSSLETSTPSLDLSVYFNYYKKFNFNFNFNFNFDFNFNLAIRNIGNDLNVFKGLVQNPIFVGILLFTVAAQYGLVEFGGAFVRTVRPLFIV